VRGEAALIDLSLENPEGDPTESLRILKQITDQMVVRTNSYRCNRCGFSAARAPLAVPELQALGHDQAAAHRGGRLMGEWMPAVAGAALAALVSALGTWSWIALARRWRLQDEPGRRRLHAQPTPRGGGVAVALGWWLATALACSWSGPEVLSPLPWLLLVTSAFLVLGLLDDFAGCRHGPRGTAAAGRVAVFTPLLPADVRGNLLLVSLLCLAFAYFVNAWNFMDGSNGMIAGQSLLIALALATWPGQEPGCGSPPSRWRAPAPASCPSISPGPGCSWATPAASCSAPRCSCCCSPVGARRAPPGPGAAAAERAAARQRAHPGTQGTAPTTLLAGPSGAPVPVRRAPRPLPRACRVGLFRCDGTGLDACAMPRNSAIKYHHARRTHSRLGLRYRGVRGVEKALVGEEAAGHGGHG
jgi:hypothetical protein